MLQPRLHPLRAGEHGVEIPQLSTCARVRRPRREASVALRVLWSLGSRATS
jgi:hypothetical protein